MSDQVNKQKQYFLSLVIPNLASADRGSMSMTFDVKAGLYGTYLGSVHNTDGRAKFTFRHSADVLEEEKRGVADKLAEYLKQKEIENYKLSWELTTEEDAKVYEVDRPPGIDGMTPSSV